VQILVPEQPLNFVACHRQADQQIESFGAQQARLVGEKQRELAQSRPYKLALFAMNKSTYLFKMVIYLLFMFKKYA